MLSLDDNPGSLLSELENTVISYFETREQDVWKDLSDDTKIRLFRHVVVFNGLENNLDDSTELYRKLGSYLSRMFPLGSAFRGNRIILAPGQETAEMKYAETINLVPCPVCGYGANDHYFAMEIASLNPRSVLASKRVFRNDGKDYGPVYASDYDFRVWCVYPPQEKSEKETIPDVLTAA